jgi:hypothetical protein
MRWKCDKAQCQYHHQGKCLASHIYRRKLGCTYRIPRWKGSGRNPSNPLTKSVIMRWLVSRHNASGKELYAVMTQHGYKVTLPLCYTARNKTLTGFGAFVPLPSEIMEPFVKSLKEYRDQ